MLRILFAILALTPVVSCADQLQIRRAHALTKNADGFAAPGMIGEDLFRANGSWENRFGNCTILFSWIPFAFCVHPAIAFSESGKLIGVVTASMVHTSVAVYELSSGRPIWRKTWGHFMFYGVPTALSFSNQDSLLQVVTDHDLRTFTVSDGHLTDSERHTPNSYIASTEKYLFVGQRGSVLLISLPIHTLLRTFECSQSPIIRIALSQDNSLLAVTDEAGIICLFNFQTATLQWKKSLSTVWKPAIATFQPESHDLIAAVEDQLIVFPSARIEEMQTIPCIGLIYDVKATSHSLIILRRYFWERPFSVLSMPFPLHATSCSKGTAHN